MRLHRGAIVSVDHAEGSGEVLGDMLTSEGVLSPRAGLDDAGRDAGEPIGRFLVRTGRASPGAVAYALRRQSRKRLRTLFTWENPRLGFRAEPHPDHASSPHPEAMPCAEAVLDVLRNEATSESLGGGALPPRDERLTLSPLGRDLLGASALRPEEQALSALLQRPRTFDEIREAVSGHPRALRFLTAMRRLRAVVPVSASGSYSLLLRKRQELRRTRDPRALLGLAPDATADDARRALRKLARDLHPDRFAQAGDASRALSGEILQALVGAQARFVEEATARPRGTAGRAGEGVPGRRADRTSRAR